MADPNKPWEKYAEQGAENRPWEKYGATLPISAPADATNTSSGAPQGIDLNAMGQRAFDMAGKWMNTPLMPASLQSKYQLGPINPAAAMSTPRNLAIGALGAAGAEGLTSDVAMTALTAPEIKQGGRDLMTPGKRLKGAGELAFAGIPGLSAASHIGGDLATVGGIKLGGSTIDEMSHNWLYNSGNDSKRFLAGTVKNAIDAHVGMLKQGAETADRAATPQGQMGSQNLTDVAPEIDRISRKYKGPLDIPLDKFDRAVNSFNVISGKSPYVDLETLLDIRTGIGKLWHSARDSMDAAAVAELRDVLTAKAKEGFERVGQGKQFESYNKVWKNRLEYEDQGILGKLLNAPSGKPYFDILNDKSLGPQLRQLNKDLSEQAGVSPSGQQVFPNDYFKTLAADHKDIYDFTNRRQGIRGVFSGITQRPMAAIPGALAGMAGGGAIGHPILGGMLGSSMSLSLADRLAAIRNMSKLGGAKGVEGLMGPRVEPDFGGGLSGQVIQKLEEGPKGGGGSKPAEPLVSTPEEIKKMQQEDREGKFVPGGEGRKYGQHKYSKIAEEVERQRAERAKRVGDTTKEAVKKEQTGSLKGYKPEDDSAKQQSQADLLRQYLSGDPADVGKKVEELRKALEKRKQK